MKTSENAPPKTSKSKKPCHGANQSIEWSFGLLVFARAFSQTSTPTIKYVSHSRSSISWSGVVCHRFAFSKKAGWLEKPCPEANQPMELSFGCDSFTRVFLRLPSTIIKYVSHRAGNRRAVFRVLLVLGTAFWVVFAYNLSVIQLGKSLDPLSLQVNSKTLI